MVRLKKKSETIGCKTERAHRQNERFMYFENSFYGVGVISQKAAGRIGDFILGELVSKVGESMSRTL